MDPSRQFLVHENHPSSLLTTLGRVNSTSASSAMAGSTSNVSVRDTVKQFEAETAEIQARHRSVKASCAETSEQTSKSLDLVVA